MVKYVQEDVTLSLTLGAFDIYSANGNVGGKWERQFSSPVRGDEMIAKVIVDERINC